jgi:hypothetical protein
MRAGAFAAAILFGLLLLASGNARSDSCDCTKSAPGTCPSGTTDCPGAERACCPVGGIPLCTTPDGCCSDAECSGGGLCVVGKCVCRPGKTLCGKACVDTNSDDSNCGACNNICGAGTKCCSGSCVSCPTGGDCLPTQPPVCVCPGSAPNTCVFGGQRICVNLKSNSLFCGNCGHHCRVGEDSTETCCNGACVNTQTNKANCGNCGFQCVTPSGGKAGVCVDLNSDAQNCGGCGLSFTCPQFSDCANGRCRAPCGAGQRCDTGKCNCPRGQKCGAGHRCVPFNR